MHGSHQAHLQSANHQNNVACAATDLVFDAQVLVAAQQAAADEAEQQLEFERFKFQGTINQADRNSPSQFKTPSTAEQEMWDHYYSTEADFDIAEDPDQVVEAAARSRFERDTERFGLWNGGLAGEDFVFGDSVEITDETRGNSEEDELLAEVMHNTCECSFEIGSTATKEVDRVARVVATCYLPKLEN